MDSGLRALLTISLSLLVLCPPVVEAQPKRLLSFVDTMEMPQISDPQASPDGTHLLFVMDKPDWKANQRIGHIYRINADGTSQVQLTFGERGESSPRWSPDGKTIALTARRDTDQHNQIYLLDTAGGEARRLTNHPSAPGSISWAPDGKTLWYLAADAKNADERERDRVQDDVYSFEETNFKQRHLWTTDLDGKTKRLIEMEWFEKWVHARSYAWERVPGDDKKDPAKTTTAQ